MRMAGNAASLNGRSAQTGAIVAGYAAWVNVDATGNRNEQSNQSGAPTGVVETIAAGLFLAIHLLNLVLTYTIRLPRIEGMLLGIR